MGVSPGQTGSCFLTTLGPVNAPSSAWSGVLSLSNFLFLRLCLPGQGFPSPKARFSASLTGLPAGSGFLGEATAATQKARGERLGDRRDSSWKTQA